VQLGRRHHRHQPRPDHDDDSVARLTKRPG
jgi:hypothetical protein